MQTLLMILLGGVMQLCTVPGAQIRFWSHDNFGEDIIINPRDGGFIIGIKQMVCLHRAVELSATSTYSGETSVPNIAKQVLYLTKTDMLLLLVVMV